MNQQKKQPNKGRKPSKKSASKRAYKKRQPNLPPPEDPDTFIGPIESGIPLPNRMYGLAPFLLRAYEQIGSMEKGQSFAFAKRYSQSIRNWINRQQYKGKVFQITKIVDNPKAARLYRVK